MKNSKITDDKLKNAAKNHKLNNTSSSSLNRH